MSSKIYSIPDFKEPEKKSSWEHKGEPKVDLSADHVSVMERQKKELRDSMAAPGALRLPPLLEAHRLRYGIPDGVFRVAPGFDRIFVYPIDPFDGKPTYGNTTILKADSSVKRDLQEGARGVLISAGLTAMDRLMSHGYEPGHVVMTNKNVPFARVVQEFSDFRAYVLVMRDGDLAGSETLEQEFAEGKKKVVDTGGDEGYCHQIAELVDGEWVVRKKKSVFVQDTW